MGSDHDHHAGRDRVFARPDHRRNERRNRYESTTELYDAPPSTGWRDIVELTGGTTVLTERARSHVDRGARCRRCTIVVDDLDATMDWFYSGDAPRPEMAANGMRYEAKPYHPDGSGTLLWAYCKGATAPRIELASHAMKPFIEYWWSTAGKT